MLRIFAVVLLGACASAARADEPKPPAAGGAPPVELAIPPADEGLLVPVEFNGATYLFALDTGAAYHVVDKSLIPPIGIPGEKITINTSGDPTQVIFFEGKNLEVFEWPPVVIGKSKLDLSEGIASADLSSVRQAADRKIMGIIGVGYFQDKIVQIDYIARRLRVYARDTLPAISWGEELPLVLRQDSHLPEINGRVGRMERQFLLDTGSIHGVSILSTDREVLRSFERKRMLRTTSGRGHEQPKRFGLLQEFQVGPFLQAYVSADESKTDNLLGLGFLRRFLFTIDVSKSRIFLSPGKDYDTAEKLDLSGLNMLRIGKQILVDFVDKESPAFDAGITAGDVITKIDGRLGEECDLPEVRRLLKSEEGREIRLTISRDGREHEKSFVLRDY